MRVQNIRGVELIGLVRRVPLDYCHHTVNVSNTTSNEMPHLWEVPAQTVDLRVRSSNAKRPQH